MKRQKRARTAEYDVTVEWRRTSTLGAPKTWNQKMTLTLAEREAFKRETFASDGDVHAISFADPRGSVRYVRGLNWKDLK